MFTTFDNYIVEVMGHYAHRSQLFDQLVMTTLRKSSFRMLPIVLCLWVPWFSKKYPEKGRLAVCVAGISGFLSLVLSRVVQNFGPERLRPIYSGNPDYVAPFSVNADILKDWSSFPSDHAALAFALSSGILLFSAPLGIFCYMWALFIVSMPRVYSGYHYATDVLFGSLIGILSFMIFFYWRAIPVRTLPFMERFEQRYTGAFYAGAFFTSYQLATMFDDIREPLQGFLKYLHLH